LKRKIVLTKDGSSSIYLPDKDEHYHSTHGAVQESMHVFIKNGLYRFINQKDKIDILEVGFGTGLNAILSLISTESHKAKINYHGIEPFPISPDELDQLNYDEFLDNEFAQSNLQKMHSIPFNQWHSLNSNFDLIKYNHPLLDCSFSTKFDLVYYDAFGPRAQPEMWALAPLEYVVSHLRNKGVFVTYCVKGSVKRNLQKLGLEVEKLPGPPGKREMMIARF